MRGAKLAAARIAGTVALLIVGVGVSAAVADPGGGNGPPSTVPGSPGDDCSHGNSNKDPALQSLVVENCANQILEGNRSIVGLMLESNLDWGNQKIPADLKQLKYGVSVTDACIDWATTEKLLHSMRDKLKNVLPKREAPAGHIVGQTKQRTA